MSERFSRTEILLGPDGLSRLKQAHVAVFGAGGVGGYVIEALARSGVGTITIVDGDTVSVSNINRQIIALSNTVGKLKTESFKERIALINPDCSVITRSVYFTKENKCDFNFSDYSYVVDAIDMVSSKVLLATSCADTETPIISSMGTGGKLSATKFFVADIYKTSVCPLARVMRRELKKAGIRKLKCVYSQEYSDFRTIKDSSSPGRNIPGSISYTPAIAGLMIAGEVICDLLKQAENIR